MKAQQETWDSVEVDGVKTMYYYGCEEEQHGLMYYYTSSKELKVPLTDSYYFMAGKFKAALEYAFKPDKEVSDFDIIFRTNSSSYVNKQKLQEFAAKLPTEKLYAGWTMEDSNFDGGLVVSGAGIFLSRDTAEILRNEIDPGVEMEEDILIGRVLRKNGIVAIDDKSRYDYTGHNLSDQMDIMLSTKYHIRFKTDNRIQDANNMRLVHDLITQ